MAGAPMPSACALWSGSVSQPASTSASASSTPMRRSASTALATKPIQWPSAGGGVNGSRFSDTNAPSSSGTVNSWCTSPAPAPVWLIKVADPVDPEETAKSVMPCCSRSSPIDGAVSRAPPVPRSISNTSLRSAMLSVRDALTSGMYTVLPISP